MKTALGATLLLALLPLASGAEGERFHPEKAEILPFPREVARNGTVTFVVKVRRGYHTPIFAVTAPDGSTEYHRPDRTPEPGTYEFDLGFKGAPGAYPVELIVDSTRGDTTAARFTVWAGVPRPEATAESGEKRPEGDYEPEDPDESTIRLERDLMRLLNGYRRTKGLAPYPWLEKAAILARSHLSDYLALEPRPAKLTHQIPGKGFLADRFEDFFAWPTTVRKFPVAEPEIGPDAVSYCSESLAAPRSLTWLFREYFLREPAFRAPVISPFPTHAAVGIVRDAKTGRLYTATVFVQVNSTRVRDGLARELADLVRAESRAKDDEEAADAIRTLARFGDEGAVKTLERRLSDRRPKVRAAALDGLFLLDLETADEWVERQARVLARAHERERYGPALPILETFAAVEFDATVRRRGISELATLTAGSEAELDAAFLRLMSGNTDEGRAALEEVAARYDGLPAAAAAKAKLAELEEKGSSD